MATGISFNFRNVYTTFIYDIYARLDILSSRGYAVICNGIDPNTKIDPDTGQTNLLMRAPAGMVAPLLTGAPSGLGKIYGDDYKWRVRYRNSQTGETSGMSPLPDVGLNLGTSWTIAGTTYYMGQSAIFHIVGTALAGVDTIELLRNLSSDEGEWFVADKGPNPGAATYVVLEDNIPDDELWNKEQASLFPGPEYMVPHPPPCARAFEHSSTGRVWLYGHYPMGVSDPSVRTGSITAGDNTINTASGLLTRTREGQRLRFDTDVNKQVFRIIEVTDPNAVVVTPASIGAITSIAFQIDDDRDTRNIYLLSPVSPAQWNPEDILTIGSDRSDGVTGVFMLGASTYVLTHKRLYALENDQSEDPVETTRIRLVAEVGCVGFWAHCVTPFGAVFVDEKRGVMLFDGNYPVPLGRDTSLKDFEPLDQFQGMDEGYLSDAYCKYDNVSGRVFISYCPVGVGAAIEQISFDPAILNWRGPWRRPLYVAGSLRDNDGKPVFLLGDTVANIMLEGDGPNDLVDSVSSGTILTIQTPVIFTATASVFLAAMVGAPILFNDGAGNYHLNWIASRISATKVILLLHPATALTVGWTFQIGAIHWQAKTAFVNLGEPGQPKHLHDLMVGYERVETTADTFVVQASPDGLSITESVDATAMTGGLIKSTAALNVGGTALTLRFSGRAVNGGPKITNLVGWITVYMGNQDPVAGTKKKVVIATTVTS